MERRAASQGQHAAATAARGVGRDCGLLPRMAEVPEAAIAEGRPWTPILTERITRDIQVQIVDYSGPRDGRRRNLIREAVHVAISDFFDLAKGRAHTHPEVDRIFRAMGAGIVAEGRDLAPMLTALQVAATDVLQAVSTTTRTSPLDGDAVAVLVERITEYLRHLAVQVERGYAENRASLLCPREALLRALTDGADGRARIDELAAASGWTVPDRVVVMAADRMKDDPAPLLRAHADLIGGKCDGQLVAIASAEAAEALRPSLLARSRLVEFSIAVSWPVSVADVRHAYRWVRRTLWLARIGRIDGDGVIDCADHALQLWRESDPLLTDLLARKALAPLDTLGSAKRAAFEETLLRWLLTRESATVIARELRVHPQTVRYRIRRLERLFEDRLSDPEAVQLIVTALAARSPGDDRADTKGGSRSDDGAQR